MKTYLSDNRVKDAVCVFKTYYEKSQEAEKSEQKKNKKPLLVDPSQEKLFLQIEFKKLPPNKSTFSNLIGPLPNHWFNEAEENVCMIVRDPQPKVFLKDRELDLQETREHYKQKLIDAGFDEHFLNQRLYIMPMRELITEYKEDEAKSKLCAAYNVFLAERSLMNNKFKELNTFLGYKFFVQRKKIPVPVGISKLEGEALKKEIDESLMKTQFCVTGKGGISTVQIGVLSQSVDEISENIFVVLKEVKRLFDNNVAMLRLKTAKSMAIPFFADLGLRSDINADKACPKRNAKGSFIMDEFPLFNHSNALVDSTGNVKIKKRKDIPDEDEDSDDEFVNEMEKKWIKITNPKNKRKKSVISWKFKRQFYKNQTNVKRKSFRK